MLTKEHQVLWMKENLIQSLEELEVTSFTHSPGGDESGTGLRKMAKLERKEKHGNLDGLVEGVNRRST